MSIFFGNFMYGFGLIGAMGSLLYAVNTIWIFKSGESILRTSGRYVSYEEMLAAVGISIALIMLSAGLCLAARSFLNKASEENAAIDNTRY
jgi:hypothetical protein